MRDRDKTKEQLVEELHELRQWATELKATEMERQRVERSLRESEERYRSIVELAPDGILTGDLRGVATSCNSAFLELTGFSRDEIVGKHLSQFPTLQIRDIPRFIRILLLVSRGKMVKPFEFVWIHKDGTSRWGEGHIGLMKEGSRIKGFQIILRDTTERKKADEALRESEERYRLIAENVTDVIWVADMNFRFTYVSPSVKDLRGYSVEEVMAQSLADVLTPASLVRAMAVLEEERENIARGTVQPQTVEFEFKCKDGSTVETESTVSILYDENGIPAGILGSTRDISERKRAEEQLQILSSVVDQSTNSIAVIDREGNVEYANPRFFQSSGFDPDTVLGKNWRSFLPPHSTLREAFPKIQKAVLGKGMVWKGEVTDRTIDGEATWREATLFPIKDAEGGMTHAVYTGADITERKQAEDALRENERFVQSVMAATPDIVHIYDLQEQRTVYSSRSVVTVLGYTPEEVELLGDTLVQQLLYPEDAARLPDLFKRWDTAKDGEVLTAEYRMRTKRGEWRWFLGRDVVFQRGPDGKVQQLVGTIQDITERKQAEEERERLLAQIREQAQRMQHILDTVPEGVLLLDAGERLILVNPIAERELVALSDARTGDTLTRLGDRPLVDLLTSPPQGLWHQVTADERSFQVIARPIEDGPTPIGWVLVIRDVTQQREIEQQVQQQERLAAVGQLAAGIAHDFNNIMATVVLYAQMTARMEDLPTTVRERMETINRQSNHATKLIQQILDFSRRAVLERRPLDLVPLLKEHVKLLARTLPESVEVALACEPDTCVVNADPTRMQQMVTNLALNAREAMAQGGELCIGLDRIVVKPGESPLLPEMAPGEWAKVTVSDTGTGIPPEALPHIFEPFFTTRAPLGSGLGLAQVHGIVGAHEGRIDVETEVGRGTTFTIYLPVHRSEPLPAPSSAELPALPRGQGETILVVEDNGIVRRALVDSLEMLNYRVLEVSDGQEALEMLEERGGEIALVLSDVVMPRMSGTALLHGLRDRGLTLPVVMLTGHPIEREMEQLRAHGMADWLPKPPQLEELAQVLARALGTD